MSSTIDRLCPECGVGIVDAYWRDRPRSVCDTCAVNWVYVNIDLVKKSTHKDAAYSKSIAIIDDTEEV